MSTPTNPPVPERQDGAAASQPGPYGPPPAAPQPQPQYQQPSPQQYQHPYPRQSYGPPPQQYWADPTAKSRVAAGLFGIFLGWLGIHRFYLGYTTIGLTQLLITVGGWVVTIVLGWIPFIGWLFAGVAWLALVGVWVWGLVEGILYLTAKQGAYAVDAQGRPLVS